MQNFKSCLARLLCWSVSTAAWDWDWANHATSEASLCLFPSATLGLNGGNRADHAEIYMGAARQRKERKEKKRKEKKRKKRKGLVAEKEPRSKSRTCLSSHHTAPNTVHDNPFRRLLLQSELHCCIANKT